jgi:hypothetical protein
MRTMVGRPQLEKDGFQFNLDGARPMGPQHIIRAAKDAIARQPQDETIIALLRRTLTRAKLSDDNSQWEIEGMTGQVYTLSLGAPYELWETACQGLLNQAMSTTNA